MSLINTVVQVADGNSKQYSFLKVIRIKGEEVMSFDGANLIKLLGHKFAGADNLDCTVPHKDFQDALKVMKAPEFSQTDTHLILKEGIMTIEIPFSSIEFPIDISTSPNGPNYQISPIGELFSTIKNIVPLLKLADSVVTNSGAVAYIIKNQMYITNGQFLVKTPLGTELPEFDKPLTIQKSFADFATKLMGTEAGAPVDVRISENHLAIVWENCWIQTVRNAEELPADFEAVYATFKDIPTEPIPEDILASLKNICAIAGKNDEIKFGPEGISVLKDGKSGYNIKHPMPNFYIPANELAKILEFGTEFNFNDPKKVVLKGPNFYGIWTTKINDAVRAKEDSKAEEVAVS